MEVYVPSPIPEINIPDETILQLVDIRDFQEVDPSNIQYLSLKDESNIATLFIQMNGVTILITSTTDSGENITYPIPENIGTSIFNKIKKEVLSQKLTEMYKNLMPSTV